MNEKTISGNLAASVRESSSFPLPREEEKGEGQTRNANQRACSLGNVDPLRTKREVTARFGMSERTIERYVAKYDMPKVMIGTRNMRFRFSEIQAFLDQRGAKRF